jgi:regulator of nucleoside diphosphate kinase
VLRNQPIVISELEAGRLRGLLAARTGAARDQRHLQDLLEELERAQVLEAGEIPSDVITMRTRVRVRDLMSGDRHELELVFPEQADVGAQRISVLAPLGTALLGYRQGNEIEWVMPGGLRRLRIERVTQPAAGGGSKSAVAS